MGETSKRRYDETGLLTQLNPVQKEAVLATQGPVLVLAGAGSGKTRVLTYRVAYLLQSGLAKPWEILAVTFTNKAAKEMRERILALVDGLGSESWIGTFHSICARLLRIEGHKIGYERNFTVFDRDDQIRFVKGIMQDLNISPQKYSPEALQSRVSSAKNQFMSAEEFGLIASDPIDLKALQVYRLYQRRLFSENVMDFDDLLVKPIELFEASPGVLEVYQKRFKYILVDEYQDTNRTQYLFLKKLAALHQNLCVVGDDDQSIYRWRGADVENILNVEHDYPKCKVFRLEQNYRSTKSILDVANGIVRKNARRHQKELWTNNQSGEKVTVIDVDDHINEALYIISSMKNELQRHGRNFGDFVILYRTNSQSRVLEDALRTAGIPYVIVGGLRFYERKEIKDVLAYLRLVCNPKDSVSFKRVINYPLRGIGDTSVTKLESFAHENQMSLLEAAGEAHRIPTISKRIQTSIRSFYDLTEKYKALLTEFSAGELARALIDETGILRSFKEIGTEEALGRAENVRELLSALAHFRSTEGETTLEAFLEEVSLITDIDTWDDVTNAVTLMTIHSAKGLEFPVVYITGLEEGLFPITRSLDNVHDLEEERRLFYVGVTRAMEKLYLTWAGRRMRFGEYLPCNISRFLKEIDPELVQWLDKRNGYYGRRETASSIRARGEYAHEYDEGLSTMPNYEDFSQERSGIAAGTRVRHAKFGTGSVLGVEGRGENTRIIVRFATEGIKTLVAKYAKLQIL